MSDEPLSHLCNSSLDSPQYVHVSPILWAQNWTQNSRCDLTSAEQRGKDCLSPFADIILPEAAKNTISPLCYKDTFPACVQRGVHQVDLFCRAAFQIGAPSGCRALHLLSLNSMRFLSAQLPRSLWMPAQLSDMTATPLVLWHCKLSEGAVWEHTLLSSPNLYLEKIKEGERYRFLMLWSLAYMQFCSCFDQ